MFSSCSGNIVIRFLRLGGIMGTELGPELCMCMDVGVCVCK